MVKISKTHHKTKDGIIKKNPKKSKYKFSELSKEAKLVAAKDYIKGWKETHPNESMSIREAMVLSMDSNDDVLYNSKGKVIEEDNFFGETIYAYTDQQAIDDGFLVDVKVFGQGWEKGLFNIITNNLLVSKGYMTQDGKPNLPNIMDLLNQVNQCVRGKSENFTKFDSFFDCSIELPSGSRQKVFVEQNGTGKFTIMLPEDR